MSQVDSAPSGSPGLREQNVAARRRRILAAARRLIAQGGLAALSMRKLAREAGLSVTTLYNLFGVREEILHALVEDAIDHMDATLEVEAPLDAPLERCRAVVDVSIRHLVENEAIFRPMWIAAYQGVSAAAFREGRVFRRASRMQSVAIAAAIERGLLRDVLDPEALGRQIYHGYELACARWVFGALSEAGFRARALYGLYVALLGVATDAVRPGIEAELRALEAELLASGDSAAGVHAGAGGGTR